MKYSKAEHGKTVHLKSGQSDFTISLPENPTTGYVWKINKLPKHIHLTKSDRILSDGKMVGSAALRIFYFSIDNHQAEGKLVLKNCRPWDASDCIDVFEFDLASSKK